MAGAGPWRVHGAPSFDLTYREAGRWVSDAEAARIARRTVFRRTGADDERLALRIVRETSDLSVPRHELGRRSLVERLARALARGTLRVHDQKLQGQGGTSVTKVSLPPSTRPPPTPKPRSTEFALVGLSYVPFIAPGAEDPLPLVRWTIEDPDALIDAGRLELRFRDREGASHQVGVRTLTPGELADGAHEMAWEGSVSTSLHFPLGFATCEHSPYELMLTVEGAGRRESRSVSFQVQVVDLELQLGSDDLVVGELHQEAVRLTRAASEGATLDVVLPSNRFFIQQVQAPFGVDAFEDYKARWPQGPSLPLVVNVLFRSSKGARVSAPRAWGRQRVLWDIDFDDQNDALQAGAAKAFVQEAASYRVAQTAPAGTACHLHRGGKRGDPSVPFFRPSGAFPFDFAVQRRAAALTSPRSSDVGDSVVDFRPARQSGEGYRVTAHFDPRERIDRPSPAAKLRRSLAVRVRREVTVTLAKKRDDTPELDPAQLEQALALRDASIRLRVRSPQHLVFDEQTWLDALEAVLAKNPFHRALVRTDVDQYHHGDFGITLHDPPPVLLPTTLSAKERGDTVKVHLFAARMNQAAAMHILLETAKAFVQAPGILIVVHGASCNLDEHAVTLARMLDPTHVPLSPGLSGQVDRDHGVIILGPPSFVTATHEIGHSLGLGHAPGKDAETTPDDVVPDAHDQADLHCLMNNDREERPFWGVCNLRLRGWDPRRISPRSPENRG